MPEKLFNSILTVGFYYNSEFLIKCVVSHIAHDIRDRVELITHCLVSTCSLLWLKCVAFLLCVTQWCDFNQCDHDSAGAEADMAGRISRSYSNQQVEMYLSLCWIVRWKNSKSSGCI